MLHMGIAQYGCGPLLLVYEQLSCSFEIKVANNNRFCHIIFALATSTVQHLAVAFDNHMILIPLTCPNGVFMNYDTHNH